MATAQSPSFDSRGLCLLCRRTFDDHSGWLEWPDKALRCGVDARISA